MEKDFALNNTKNTLRLYKKVRSGRTFWTKWTSLGINMSSLWHSHFLGAYTTTVVEVMLCSIKWHSHVKQILLITMNSIWLQIKRTSHDVLKLKFNKNFYFEFRFISQKRNNFLKIKLQPFDLWNFDFVTITLRNKRR